MTQALTGAEEVAWDLTHIYESGEDPRLHSEVASALARGLRFSGRYHGRVADLDAGELAEAVAELEDMEATLFRAGSFAYLEFATDTADPARGALLQHLREKGTELRTSVLFFELEWVALDDERAAALLADPRLDRYRHYLESARRYRPYLLSEPEEKILAKKNDTAAGAWSRLFTELTSALRVRIPPGGDEELSFELAQGRLQQPDREVRRQAAEGITEALAPGLRTRAFVMNTLLHDKAIEDRLRGYPHWLSARNLSNETSDEAVQALVDAVVARYDIPPRYYRLKAKLLGLDRLEYYDRTAPVGGATGTTAWVDARSLVLDAYRTFSPVAGDVIEQFFESRWIDAAVRPNKQHGAFCATTVPGVHPYVLMSFTGERRSVLTLAHELGHGLHGYLADEQGFFNATTPLTLAETASVFGEALTFRRLMARESDPQRKLALLTGRLEDAIATIFRQIAMNRFEDRIHTVRRGLGELSTDAIAEFWIETQRDMLGDAVVLSDGYRSWWSYIPHFIGSPGYVYAYAFGYLFSLAIYRRYEEVGEPMVGPYLDMLRAGGSKPPEALAAMVGLDLADPGFWAGGLETVDRLLGEAETLANGIGGGSSTNA
ncbi:MAG TPA: M3 family oligoendopeptidase [Actinomycetota bacterium]|jgi:oligoendopeptidase F